MRASCWFLSVKKSATTFGEGCIDPADTWRNDNVSMTSKRCRNIILSKNDNDVIITVCLRWGDFCSSPDYHTAPHAWTVLCFECYACLNVKILISREPLPFGTMFARVGRWISEPNMLVVLCLWAKNGVGISYVTNICSAFGVCFALMVLIWIICNRTHLNP